MISQFKEKFLQSVPESSDRRVSVLLGVSGGVDSITMASLFLKLNLDLRLAVAHVNFSLRGEASDGDQTFVENWCAERGVQCFVKKFDTRQVASTKGISLEMAARELRYGWFDELSDNEGFEYIAVAHNQNDNVETLFLNLVRGTGINGITGMKPISGKIIRPMLSFSRAQIEYYCQSEGIQYRVDATNADVDFHRNRIRNNIFPELHKINPSFLDTVSRDMGYFADASSILEELKPAKIAQLSYWEDEVLNISIPLLKREKYRAYWLFEILERFGFNSSQVSQISVSVDSQSGKQFFSDTHKLIRDRNVLKVYPVKEIAVREYTFDIIEKPSDFNPRFSSNDELFVDAHKVLSFSGTHSIDDLKSFIKCRQWMLCDKFIPLGMKGSKLVSDFFNGLKLDLEQKNRERIVTVFDGKEKETIVAIASRRIDDRFKVTDTTSLLLRIAPVQCSPTSR